MVKPISTANILKMPACLPVSSLSSYNFRSESCTTTSGASSGQNSSDGQHSPTLSPPKQESLDVTEEAIMSSIVYCIHHKDGCNWSDELRRLKAHLNCCKYDAISCPAKCNSNIPRLLLEDHLKFTCKLRRTICSHCNKVFTGEELENHNGSCVFEPIFCEMKCGKKVVKKNMSVHMTQECTKRLVPCLYCKKEFVSDTLPNHHAQCPRYPVICPNRCKGSQELRIPRDEVDMHLKEKCSGILIPCQFREHGCKFRGQRPALEEHMKEEGITQQHLSLLALMVTKQQSQISCLRTALSKLTINHTGTLVWKITDLASKMREAKTKEGVELISNSFYTGNAGEYGYKLQVSVFLNGNGVGENSHISVYIKILPGEYDSILKWPFSQAVSFCLFDQNPNGEKTLNIVESFNPDPSWKNFQRPSREPDSLGFGFPRFVSHETLNKRNYIRDDCIFLRVKVEPGKIVAV